MYKASRTLPSISPEELDQYLSMGWFRMEQTIFTTQFLQEDDCVFRDAIWLRYRLRDFRFPAWFLKMRQQAKFRLEISNEPHGPVHELLYQKYRETMPADWPKSLENVLYGASSRNIYRTTTINLFDGDQLIAAGFMDLGAASAAGIVNYYDPAYAKYSLGKCLLLLEIEHAMMLGMKFFYPGYFAPGNPRFDYKLAFHPPSLEFYDAAYKSWLHYRPLTTDELPLEQIEARLCHVQAELLNEGNTCWFVHNASFAIVDNSRHDSPYIIFIPATETCPWQYAITYDTNIKRYLIFNCTELDHEEFFIETEDKIICMQFLSMRKPLAEEFSAGRVGSKIRELNHYFNEMK
jgi:arginine-tRNA-protein transferase